MGGARDFLFRLRAPPSHSSDPARTGERHRKAADRLGTRGLRDERASSWGFLMRAHLPQGTAEASSPERAQGRSSKKSLFSQRTGKGRDQE